MMNKKEAEEENKKVEKYAGGLCGLCGCNEGQLMRETALTDTVGRAKRQTKKHAIHASKY